MPLTTIRELIAQYGGSVSGAARGSGIPRTTLRHRLAREQQLELAAPPDPAFNIDDPLSPTPSSEELLARRKRTYQLRDAAALSRELIPVQIRDNGPIGLAIFGDPHLDDDGTDIALIERHLQIVRDTPALWGVGIGDYSNNWVGRLARLYGQQSTSAAEAWVLVEWFVKQLNWLVLLAGNHDLFSGEGDPIQWMAKHARVRYESHGARLGITFPNGRVIRINARHDFRGRSQWSPAFGVAKAAQLGFRDHVLVAGHIHTSGYQIVKDPQSGLISHAIRVGSYETHSRFAEERGFLQGTFTVCPVVVIDPTEPDDSNRCIQLFLDPEYGADYLTWLRAKRRA